MKLFIQPTPEKKKDLLETFLLMSMKIAYVYSRQIRENYS